MNNSLIKKNLGSALFIVILVLVLIVCTKNPISNFIFTLLNPHKIYNATDSALSLCYRTGTSASYTYNYINIAAGSSATLMVDSITGPVLILKSNGKTSGAPTAPTDIEDRPFAVAYISNLPVSSASNLDAQPVMNLYDILTFSTAIAGTTTVSNTVSGFDGPSLNNANKISKSLVILEPFRISDYSTYTDTTETGNNYNSITLSNDDIISRYVLHKNNIPIQPPSITSGVLNNISVYSRRSSSDEFSTEYCLPPNITGAQAPTTSSLPTYIIKSASPDATKPAFNALLLTDTKFFYGQNASSTTFNYTTTGSLVTSTIGNITLSYSSNNFTSMDTTPYEIRYRDTIINSTDSEKTIIFYKLIKTADNNNYTTDATADSRTLGIDDENNTYFPLTMPYIVSIPANLIIRDGNTDDTTQSVNEVRYIYRSFDTTNSKDVKFIWDSSTLPINTVGFTANAATSSS